jgi:hypothetical protein
LIVPALFHCDSDLRGDILQCLQSLETNVRGKNQLLRVFMRSEQTLFEKNVKTKGNSMGLEPWQGEIWHCGAKISAILNLLVARSIVRQTL